MKKNYKKGFLVKSFQSLFLCSSLLIFSCEQQEEKLVPAPPIANTEEAFIGETGTIKSGTLYGMGIKYSEIQNQKVFEGDIILTEEQLSPVPAENGRTEGAGRTTGRWPNAVVYYSIDPALSNQARVTSAIAHWQANSSLRFVQRTTQANYVRFRPGDGCSSSVGMVGGVQYVTLGSGCSTGNTIHEIGHAIGIWHEQSRADRDNHIRILWQNILSESTHNFNKYREGEGFDHGGFDFNSIMMYSAYAFSSNNQPTITKLDGSLYTVQRDALSSGDKAIAAAMYPSAGFSTTIEAENYISMSGIFTEPCSEGGLNVGSFDAGDWTAYSVNIPSQGRYRVTYRVASPFTGKSLRLERANGTVNLGTIGIPNTGGWQNWTSVSHDVDLPAGAYSIGIATSTGGLNINKFSITKL
jgi:hypothetical protein